MDEPTSAATGFLRPDEGVALMRLAVAAVRAKLLAEQFPMPVPRSARLRSAGASFVTLERAGRLLGCIGTLQASRPLYVDVVRNARRAMADPRLPPVGADAWPALDVKVSVLSAPEPVAVAGRDALVATLRPGVDGLLLTDGMRRATFLPSVWVKLAEPDRFVAALLAKGGWPATEWPADLAVSRYTTHEFHDAAPRGPLVGSGDTEVRQDG